MLLQTMMNLIARTARRHFRSVLTIGGVLLAGNVLAEPLSGQDVLKKRCAACHMENGKLQRISDLRKTPEGWEMCIVRMQIWHKVDVPKDERKILVKYLSDRQGLAPAETAPYRFLVERRPNAQDVMPSEELGQMCGRCHSFGRVALQRRNRAEWTKLVHTHLGQFPSIEYSAFGRDRDWKDLAFDKVVPQLASLYPVRTAAWKNWQGKKHVPPTGNWRIAGHRPGWGDYAGTMTVQALGNDQYDVRYVLDYASGNVVSGKGTSIIYSGYEWRGDATLGDENVRSVFALSQDGNRISGRWFLRDSDEIGASFEAVQADRAARSTVLAVYPSLLKAGGETAVRVHGVKLGKDYELGPGTRVTSAKEISADEVELTVSVAADAPLGPRSLRAGKGGGKAGIAIYQKFDSIRVEPAFGIARLGGGTNVAAPAQFQAVAYLNGPDGQAGTGDDIRLGYVPASWRVDNHNEKAKADDDARFAGVMDPNGLFMPAAAGPNPERKGLNNVGDLSVIATVNDGARTIDGTGHLIVTVQRWNKPPLR